MMILNRIVILFFKLPDLLLQLFLSTGQDGYIFLATRAVSGYQLTSHSLEDLIRLLNERPHPLAAYYFSSDKALIRRFTAKVQFGGGCINDAVIHLATSAMPFGGVGASGMGSYHGKAGFDTFSHKKSIVDKKTFIDLPMRYQPYTKVYDALIRMFLR